MPDINDIHRFYEANIPEYERKDIHVLNGFFLDLMGINSAKPINAVLIYFQKVKEFVCYQWQGASEIKSAATASYKQEKKVVIMPYGKYKGENMDDIPIDYFIWLRDNEKASKIVLEHLKYRLKK